MPAKRRGFWNPVDHPRGKGGLFQPKGNSRYGEYQFKNRKNAKATAKTRAARINAVSRSSGWSAPLPPDPWKALQPTRVRRAPAKKGAFQITTAKKPRKSVFGTKKRKR